MGSATWRLGSDINISGQTRGSWRLPEVHGFPPAAWMTPIISRLWIGSGAYALLFRLNHDYAISSLWKGTHDSTAEETPGGRAPGTVPGTVVLNGTIRYDLVLPDKQVKRVPDHVNNPLTANKETSVETLGTSSNLRHRRSITFLPVSPSHHSISMGLN